MKGSSPTLPLRCCDHVFEGYAPIRARTRNFGKVHAQFLSLFHGGFRSDRFLLSHLSRLPYAASRLLCSLARNTLCLPCCIIRSTLRFLRGLPRCFLGLLCSLFSDIQRFLGSLFCGFRGILSRLAHYLFHT